jgi:hypothetical protein
LTCAKRKKKINAEKVAETQRERRVGRQDVVVEILRLALGYEWR